MSDVNIQTFSGKVNVSNNFTVGSGHLFVDTQNNKVGLNTTTPEANLHVTGNTYISTDISVGGTLTMGTVTVEALHSLDAVTSVGNTTPHTVEFQNTDTSLVASGNVQANYFIGNGSELSNISLQQVTDAGNTTSNTLLLTNTDTSLVASGNVEIGTANLFVDTVTGRVGIGTDVPAYDFDVQSSSDAADKTMARLYSRENATGVSSTGLIFEKGTGYGGVIKGFISQGIGSGLSLHTLNGGTEAQSMTIMNSGNVGIGTTDPSEKLEVDGHIVGTGSIIQMVHTNTVNNFSTNSGATSGDIPLADATGVKLSITPKKSNSTILVMMRVLAYFNYVTGINGVRCQVWRKIGSTYTKRYYAPGGHDLHYFTYKPYDSAISGGDHVYINIAFTDQPGTTSTCEYELRAQLYLSVTGSANVQIGNGNNQPVNIQLFEIGG